MAKRRNTSGQQLLHEHIHLRRTKGYCLSGRREHHPDMSVHGFVTVEFYDVTLEEALRLILSLVVTCTERSAIPIWSALQIRWSAVS